MQGVGRDDAGDAAAADRHGRGASRQPAADRKHRSGPMTTADPHQAVPYRPDGRVVFETPRLIGRHLVAADAEPMFAVYGDAGAMRWVGDGNPLERERCVRWIDVTHRNYERYGYGMTALLDRTTHDVVGFIGLVHPNGQPEAELKYALRRACWGRGLATEAASARLAYAAAVLGLYHVIATAAPEHVVSHRVLLKAGLQRDGVRLNADGSQTQMFAWRAPSVQNAG
jgi:RimJ/RimL family protein N-acetyltransferase